MKMNIEVDLSLGNEGWYRLFDYWKCWEDIETDFKIDVSCGDGKYIPDLPIVNEYDGLVDAHRFRSNDREYFNEKMIFSFDYEKDADEVSNCEVI